MEECAMRRTFAVIAIALLTLGISCKPAENAAPVKSSSAAARASVPIDPAAVLDVLANGDQADIQDALQTLVPDRAGWASGKYETLCRPLWALFVKISGTETGPANTELRSILHNVFNLGNWYGMLDDFLAALNASGLPAAVREEAAGHLWRFAGKAKAGKGFAIPAADRPKIEAAVTLLLNEKTDLTLLSSAVTTAALLEMKSAVPRLKAIVAEQPFDNTETRSFRFTLGEALYNLSQVGPAVDVMRKLSDSKGDFSEEAAEFLKSKGLF